MKRTSAGEDFVQLVSLMPWWLGLTVALLSYLLLHRLAAYPLPHVASATRASDLVTPAVLRGLAQLGQYVIPVLCIAGAGISAYRRRTRQKLLADVTARRTAEPFADLSWQQFEQLVGELFRKQGYAAEETGGGGADGGVDLVLRRGGERHLVQCKQWRAYKVGVDTARELYGVMAARGAAGGFVVTSGRFTDEAKAFAEGRNIQLVDGACLRQWTDEPRSPEAATTNRRAPRLKATESPSPSANVRAPSCPVCGNPTVPRQARRGAQPGRYFWGCTQFPSCRGTRPKDEVPV